ncbi:hypothetical protein NLU13_1254 [Sarocladium strictum]|uniref:Thymocyte nuclear protein 1 n=1 Tax=Sarocladium strictum TaxID=5046 RepID=A0AA39GQM5_SARSR|nr:hypothetical protein NLU13_1254 [Sarocladium strictum]
MAPRKRAAAAVPEAGSEPSAKRRSSRLSVGAAADQQQLKEETPKKAPKASSKTTKKASAPSAPASEPVSSAPAKAKAKDQKKQAKQPSRKGDTKDEEKPQAKAKSGKEVPNGSDDVDPDDLPDRNPEAPRHDGEWYWLMKAEPESRFENGIDVRFSIDDLRAKTKPEGWDGIRAYAARNHMRNMNLGDKAFFYHSNCKEPGIVGVMEIVKEFSEDRSARRPGTPYYDPKSTAENPRWSLVHVAFRKKFAVPITLKELRELGNAPGKPLAEMQMLKQSRLSVSRVSAAEWKTLCDLADEKAKQAGLEHEV